MDFTDAYRQTSNLVTFSPGAQFILAAVENRIIVRRSDTFQIARTWLVDTSPSATSAILNTYSKKSNQEGWISHLAWSSDSEYMLAACAKRGVVCVFKTRDESWDARIEAGTEGLVRAEWAPDGRHILCFSEWGLRVTIWSLATGLATYIQFPKHPDRGYAFRRDGRYFLLTERHKSKDTLGVYDAAEDYKLVRHFPLPTTSAASLAVSPSGNHVAIWDTPLEYKLYIINLVGHVLGTFSPPEPDVALGLGIRSVTWHPSSAFLAVGGYDDKNHILTCHGWGVVATFDLTPRIPSGVVVWKEPPEWLEATEHRGFLPYDCLSASQNGPLSFVRPDPSKPNPKSGLAQLEWNIDGTYLLARYEQSPTTIHVYSFPSPSSKQSASLHSILTHTKPVLRAYWNPTQPGLLMACCSGTGAIYTWTDGVAECVGIPAREFEVRDLKWSPDGRGALLLDKEAFCCAFLAAEEEEGESSQDFAYTP